MVHINEGDYEVTYEHYRDEERKEYIIFVGKNKDGSGFSTALELKDIPKSLK